MNSGLVPIRSKKTYFYIFSKFTKKINNYLIILTKMLKNNLFIIYINY